MRYLSRGNGVCKLLGYILQGDNRAYCMEGCMMRGQKTVAELHWYKYME